jgi:hypothetical protein
MDMMMMMMMVLRSLWDGKGLLNETSAILCVSESD